MDERHGRWKRRHRRRVARELLIAVTATVIFSALFGWGLAVNIQSGYAALGGIHVNADAGKSPAKPAPSGQTPKQENPNTTNEAGRGEAGAIGR